MRLKLPPHDVRILPDRHLVLVRVPDANWALGRVTLTVGEEAFAMDLVAREWGGHSQLLSLAPYGSAETIEAVRHSLLKASAVYISGLRRLRPIDNARRGSPHGAGP